MNTPFAFFLILLQFGCTTKKTEERSPSPIEAREDTGFEESDSAAPSDPEDTAPIDTGADTSDSAQPEDTDDTGEAPDPAPACYSYDSQEEDYAPIQTTGAPLPDIALQLAWIAPTDYLSYAHFSGTTGDPANHEGIDYIHSDSTSPNISVYAAGAGVVVYVRTGCPQDTIFSANNDRRECGSGWGNHVVIDHGSGIYTRYAHLSPNSIDVLVGDLITRGDIIAQMGNTGRSDVRHLHFELGTKNTPFDPCDISQSMELVYDPAVIPELSP